MRFAVVNGRTPRPRSLCVECSQPISESYLRVFVGRQFYCDHECYALWPACVLCLLTPPMAHTNYAETMHKRSPEH